ncbi:hypothetical protein EYM_05820 [Ignicoccus islandicus DSM 13165]|uniref:Late embryogenesis abundant protein LEA-2 subgroup domain-containing protein n=1 Tax=Ignicoccus islandicus DSM 13165 TaxID=940295 RepID=A0A0U2WNT6_9CREN|nr:hypothetical protein [Ignicoccus islandicus]ALU12625.1 hypothetical protein EYM_05820 [Ignicoccus islandicus DSM 13165]
MNSRKGFVDLTLVGIALAALLLLVGVYYFFIAPKAPTSVEAKAKAYKAIEVQLRPIKTVICVDKKEEAIFELSLVNPITNPKAYVQLVISAPPGVTVYAGQGVKGGSGLVTTNTVLEPGDAATMRIRVIGVEQGKKILSGTVYYWFEGEDKKDAKRIDLDFPVDFVICGK